MLDSHTDAFRVIECCNPVELLDIDPNAYDGQSGCAGDIGWVYQNLLVKSAAPHQAPNAGAWGLLKWARRNSDKFFPLWAKTMPEKAVQSFEPWKAKENPPIQNIEKMLNAIGEKASRDVDSDEH